MELGYCANEIEAKSVTCRVTAGLQSSEPPNDARKIDRGDTGTVVHHLQANAIVDVRECQPDDRFQGCVPLCIFNQVDGGLSQKLPIALNIQSRGN